MPDIQRAASRLKTRRASRSGRAASPVELRLRIGLEVALITTGVLLALAGEQCVAESAHHRELAHASLLRFRSEFQANRAEVLRVRDRHAKELKDLQAHQRQRQRDHGPSSIRGSRIPTPVLDTVTPSSVYDYAAWDFSLATQSLAYIDPELVASMSSAYRMQEIYQQAHRAIQQASYSFTDPVYFIRGVTFYFDDAVLYEGLLLKRYDEILPRLDRAIGDKGGTSVQ
jgi:hypothetical protein